MNSNNRKFKWYYLFFYFGSIYATLDVLFMLTLPALIVYFIYPPLGIYILVLHYLYEVFLSEGALDHNPAIRGATTRFFAWGQYHLHHHRTWMSNYGLIITLWDNVFRTKDIERK
jgi:sterol desaturase/sphingolipid hydroxylase (fatty acid hydroxylase superfamily)